MDNELETKITFLTKVLLQHKPSSSQFFYHGKALYYLLQQQQKPFDPPYHTIAHKLKLSHKKLTQYLTALQDYDVPFTKDKRKNDQIANILGLYLLNLRYSAPRL